MLITVFVFLGIEGASVYSRYARKRSDIGGDCARLPLGAFGVRARHDGPLRRHAAGGPASATPPSTATVFESMVGNWGEIFIKVGVVISVLGAYLAWTLMACEVLYVPRQHLHAPGLDEDHRQRHAVIGAAPGEPLCPGPAHPASLRRKRTGFHPRSDRGARGDPHLLAAGYALKLTIRREDS